MAIRYEDFLPEVISMVPACPEVIAERAIRSATIELCEKTDAYQAQLDPISVITGIYEYDLEPPRGTLVQRIIWVTHEGKILEPISTSLLEQRKEDWRNDTGAPEYFVKQSLNSFYIAPVPNKTVTSGIEIRVSLKPTITSTAADDQLMTDYRDTIVNGALFRLCRMPSKDWTDYNAAQVYSTLFADGLVYAERRARQADTPVAAKVRYGGLYSGRKTGKYSGRKNFL